MPWRVGYPYVPASRRLTSAANWLSSRCVVGYTNDCVAYWLVRTAKCRRNLDGRVRRVAPHDDIDRHEQVPACGLPRAAGDVVPVDVQRAGLDEPQRRVHDACRQVPLRTNKFRQGIPRAAARGIERDGDSVGGSLRLSVCRAPDTAPESLEQTHLFSRLSAGVRRDLVI